MNQNKVNTKRLDTYAIGLSGLCLLHCILTTFFIPLMPVIAAPLFQDELVHEILFLLAFPLSMIALYLGRNKHNTSRYLVIGSLGLSLMFAGLFNYANPFTEVIFTTMGVLIVAVAHFGNFLSHRKQFKQQKAAQASADNVESSYSSANIA